MPNTPTIKNLTHRQRTLVDTLVSQDISITKASEIAGYAKGESGRVVASKTLRLPHVQEYMMQQVGQHLALSSISSVKFVPPAVFGNCHCPVPIQRLRKLPNDYGDSLGRPQVSASIVGFRLSPLTLGSFRSRWMWTGE